MVLIVMGVLFLLGGAASLIVALTGSVTSTLGPMIMGGTFLFVGLLLMIVGFLMRAGAAAKRQLLATGLPGEATVTGLRQTGVSMNRGQYMQIGMQLSISVQGRPPYAVQHTEFVPMIMVGRLSTGAPLAVKVDPANPQRIAIDWSASTFGQMAR
jgi:hypothetical protein